MFNNNQPSYKNLRSIVRERTNRVVAWVGSGLNVAAGLPTWNQLKRRLCIALGEKAESMEVAQKEYLKKQEKQIAEMHDYWLAFQLLHKALGKEI
jgi:hypothetical protein